MVFELIVILSGASIMFIRNDSIFHKLSAGCLFSSNFTLMKTIVVSTDFSTPSENALLYAGNLARDVGASILLFHAFQAPVSMNEMPTIIVSIDQLKHNADIGLNREREIVQNAIANMDVKIESRLGDVVEELKDVCDREKPLCIVVGKHGTTGIENALFGSTSLSIVRNSDYPVIVVPDIAPYQPVRNMALAIDTTKDLPQDKIQAFVQVFDAQLSVIHIRDEHESEEDLTAIGELLSRLLIVKDDSLMHGIENFLESNAIDLLIVNPHKHSLLERLFSKKHLPELLQKTPIPVLCIKAN